MWSTVRLGNNMIHGDPVARTLLVVGGSRLFDAERRGDALFVSADVYDDHGRRIGVFAANRWTARRLRSSCVNRTASSSRTSATRRSSSMCASPRRNSSCRPCGWVPVMVVSACSMNGAA